VLIIVNPAAAGGRAGREWPEVRGRLNALGLEAEHRLTEAPGHATELAAEAVAAGIGTVVALGGDGTYCEVAEGLYRAGGGVLGLLPAGTGNDAARTLGVPLDLAGAVHTVRTGRQRPVDLVKVGDRLVLNAIGVGLTADINRRAARIKFMRGITVYALTALVSLFRYASPTVRLEAPDFSYEGDMVLLAVHNGPTTGGGFNLTPAAVPDDGLLDAAVVPGVGPLGRLPRLLAAMRGTLGRQRGTVELQVPHLDVHFSVPLPVHLDGNQDQLEPPHARFEVVRGALSVLVPDHRRA
jgi:YegS/Rv2252/BmrU family lipid kinase